MIVIGIVGRPAAGKSTVARMLEAHGAVVLDADRIAHAVLDEPEVRRAIGSRFGADVMDARGRVRRSAIAALVFGSTESHMAALESLEAIIHPRVQRRIEDRLAEIRAAGADGGRVVVLDVPLLMQSGWDEFCDRLLVVECDERERQRRMAARGWSAEQRTARERAWNRRYRSPDPKKTDRVDGSSGEAYTRIQVDRIWDSIRRN
jgi:dephospho-CoA kinase